MAYTGSRLTKIAVEGYKSLAGRHEIEVRPLTILAGANSSGKSSIVQPLLLLKQTLESSSDPGALLLNGPHVQFTDAEQLLSRQPPRGVASCFTVGVTDGELSSIEIKFERKQDLPFEVASMICSFGGKSVTVEPGMSPRDARHAIGPWFAKRYTHLPKDMYWSVGRERCLLVLQVTAKKTGAVYRDHRADWWHHDHVQLLKQMIHVPGLRKTAQRTYQKNTSGPMYEGTFENYIASIISRWQQSRSTHLRQLASALKVLGLTWKIAARRVDDVTLEILVGRPPRGARGGGRDLVSIADVGIGVSQVLPVLVALIAAEPGRTVYLEEPEIHLHPQAQRALARLLAAAAKRGVVVICETHSSLLLKEIQTLVAKHHYDKDAGLDPTLVKLHWFERDTDGSTHIESRDLDENGAAMKWPVDFSEIEMEADKEYLDAVETPRPPREG